jgi:hypothetical protein
MTDPDTTQHVAAALAAARYRAIRTGLLTLHKAVLDAERRRYERAHGPIENPGHALRLVMEDPWFAWLRPLAELIIQADERLATDVPLEPADVRTLGVTVRGLLHFDFGGSSFHDAYLRTLQDVPDVVVAHAHVVSLLADLPND